MIATCFPPARSLPTQYRVSPQSSALSPVDIEADHGRNSRKFQGLIEKIEHILVAELVINIGLVHRQCSLYGVGEAVGIIDIGRALIGGSSYSAASAEARCGKI